LITSFGDIERSWSLTNSRQTDLKLTTMPATTTVLSTAPSGDAANSAEPTVAAQRARPPQTPRVPLHQTYALPVPIRTFPLPTFYPNNPISLLHLAYAWLRQVVSPPHAEPTVHIGVWDPDTRSVHVNDVKSIRALWEQGFFGKGSLSRSEPNWLKRELSRRAGQAGSVSEARTEARREERRNAKWERAKAELEALEQQRLEETRLEEVRLEEARLVEARLAELQAAEAKAQVVPQPTPGEATPPGTPPMEAKPPVGPAELLALPNSLASLTMKHIPASAERTYKPPVGPAELLALPNSSATGGLLVVSEASASTTLVDKHLDAVKAAVSNGLANGIVSPPASVTSASGSAGSASTEPKEDQLLKRRKSVRFSPQVESTTFQHHDPPSPRHSAGGSPPRTTSALVDGTADADVVVAPSPPTITPEEAPTPVLENTIAVGELANKEHFQLAPEEAFFLVFALGALSVIDPVTLAPISTDKLLDLFRAFSYYPPLEVSSPSVSLQPQDPFLVNFAVYHHFRSLGWVPRHGIKFGVDYILYQRGPVFDHSEFGVMVLPSFSDKQWEKIEHESPKKTWSWLMGVNRVLSHVLKSMVLVYVDIPPPLVFEEAMRHGGIAEALKKYTIREVMVRRFSANRNRD
jgi:tRNA-splicing endonuclease subunit Sen2